MEISKIKLLQMHSDLTWKAIKYLYIYCIDNNSPYQKKTLHVGNSKVMVTFIKKKRCQELENNTLF